MTATNYTFTYPAIQEIEQALILTPQDASLDYAAGASSTHYFLTDSTRTPAQSLILGNLFADLDTELLYTPGVPAQNYTLTDLASLEQALILTPQGATLTYAKGPGSGFGIGIIAGTTVTTTQTTPLTLLEAINEMLAAVGRGPITSVDQPDAGDEAEKAMLILSNASVAIQSRGWWYNSEYEYPLYAQGLDGTIELPSNVLTVRNSIRQWPKQLRPQFDRNRTFTMRAVNGTFYLYDIANQTFSWIANVKGFPVAQPLVTGALAVDMVLAFPFEDIPQPVRWYITCKAGRDWAVGRVPDMNTYRFTDAVLQDAEAEALAFDREMRPQEPEVNPHFKMMRRR